VEGGGGHALCVGGHWGLGRGRGREVRDKRTSTSQGKNSTGVCVCACVCHSPTAPLKASYTSSLRPHKLLAQRLTQ
jgi:hypothetical protein